MMTKPKKKSERKKRDAKTLKVPKKIRRGKIRKMLPAHALTFSDIQRNIGATLIVRRFPGLRVWTAFFTNTNVRSLRGKHTPSAHTSCFGEGMSPGKAMRNLAEKLRGKVLYPTDKGPCADGKMEMHIVSDVVPD